MPIRFKNTRAKRMGVLLFILSPLAVLAALCWLLYLALAQPARMTAEPRGAGAGRTGMSNEFMGLGKERPPGPPPKPPAR